MSTGAGTSDPERNRRIEEVLAEFFLAADAGRAPEGSAWLARYSDLQPELGSCWPSRRAWAGCSRRSGASTERAGPLPPRR